MTSAGNTGMNDSHCAGSTGQESLLVTARQAAALLSISERTLWEVTHRGELPAVRIGRAVRYQRNDLEKWIQQKKQCHKCS